MRLLKSIPVLLVMTVVSVKAQNAPGARFGSFCGLLQSKIYCYGGLHGTRDQDIVDTTMFVLDISKANGANMSDFESGWKIETPNTSGVNTEKRRYSQRAVVGGTRLVVSGGFGGADIATHLVDQTIVFDAETKSWKKYPNYIESPFGNRQIYSASTTIVPSKGLAFYGGFEHHINTSWTIQTNQNLTATEFNNGYSRAIGYAGVTYLDITNTSSPWTVPYQTNAPSVFSAYQSSIFDPSSQRIFYFGGTYEDTLLPGYVSIAYKTWHRFSYALTFNTVNGAWGNETLKGAIIPSDRRYHTTTLLPNGESTVLLYGGEKAKAASHDYCFTLDLKSLTWTQQSINATFVDLLRSYHSAILVNNDTLFIVHGLNGLSTVTSMPIVLNVSNPLSITYLEKYTDPNVTLTASALDEAPSGLGSGAIAGITVSVVMVVALASTAVFFWLRKKKAEEEQRREEAEAEPIGLDWDDIERHFQEVPGGIGMGALYPAALHPVTSKDESVTVVEDAAPQTTSYVLYKASSRSNTINQVYRQTS